MSGQGTPQPAPNPYPATSRHFGLATQSHAQPDGRIVTYLARRLVTDPDRLLVRGTHEVRDGERLDQIAAAELADPASWWLLVEATVADHPDDLVAEPGRRLNIAFGPQVSGGAG